MLNQSEYNSNDPILESKREQDTKRGLLPETLVSIKTKSKESKKRKKESIIDKLYAPKITNLKLNLPIEE